ncbi:MAG: sprT domain-containing protein [Bacteroidetes bacterium]|nr:sprT domain-containing protein [Fibrella sp.]
MASSQLFHHVPAPALTYCEQLRQQFAFTLLIVKPRRTRLGDFRAFPSGVLQITVNTDLNPYAFLVTYVHEVAHAAVFRAQPRGTRRSRRPKPHGPAWQQAFRDLMQPLLTEAIFPPAILVPLRAYLQRPAATTAGSPALMAALRLADPPLPVIAGQSRLADLAEGQAFVFQKKIFIRGALRRTRIVCKETASGRSYAILAQAEVLAHD